MIGIKAEISGGLVGILRDIEEYAGAGFANVLLAVEAEAKELAPRKTGRLRNSITTHLSGRTKGALVSAAPYSSFLHEGTGLYGPRKRMIVIRPRKKQALWWKGAPHPVREVVQKGIKPRMFIRRSLRGFLLKKAFEEGFERRKASGAGRHG